MKTIKGIKLYNTKEIANLLDVGVTTVTSYRRKGLIKATRIGKSYYYSENALTEYLEGRLAFEEERREIGKQVN